MPWRPRRRRRSKRRRWPPLPARPNRGRHAAALGGRPARAATPSAGQDQGALVVFDLRTGDRVGAAMDLPPKAYGPVLHPDGTALACSLSAESPNTIVVYSTKTGQEITRIESKDRTHGFLGL